jgi:hypothetical protein
MPKKKETTEEFQKRTFPGRVKAVKKKASAALAADEAIGKGSKRLTTKQRGKHQAALAAASRVEKRMKIGTQKKESAGTVTRPGKNGSTPAERRKPIEKATGTAKTRRALEGVNELIRAGRK